MELREWATRILSGNTLEDKLFEPDSLTDQLPGSAFFWKEPSRPIGLGFQKHFRKDKLPKIHELSDPYKRAVCLHRFAGHELLAVEIMAYALLAFPDAPRHFRKGVANTLREEQTHVCLYIKEMKRLGILLGDLPLYKHFWAYTPYIRTPEQYVSIMSLTFEMANLDFAPLFGTAFSDVGDLHSSKLMEQIVKDEIAHVGFGWNWLNKLKNPKKSQWQAWVEALPSALGPHRSMGSKFKEENRKMAGISDEWLANFYAYLGKTRNPS